jgi:hypothetical protein
LPELVMLNVGTSVKVTVTDNISAVKIRHGR